MHITTFIDTNADLVLDAWNHFAQSPGSSSERGRPAEMRAHAEGVLKAIVHEMRRLESHNAAHPANRDLEHPAELQLSDHFAAGYAVDELVDEFRALRFSVLRLWTHAQDARSVEIDDIAVFNEAVDRLLAKAVAQYTVQVGQTQSMYLAMLGHDVRTPLGTIMLGAQKLFNDEGLSPANANVAHLILKSARRVDGLLNDLLDFAVTKLSPKLPVSVSLVNLRDVCEQVRAELRAVFPDQIIKIDATGDLSGAWDRNRICQAVSNVVSNAIEHGSKDHPVCIALSGDANFATVRVHNVGDTIDAATLKLIFDPVTRHVVRAQQERSRVKKQNLGLGMYIARQVIASHGGEIYMASDSLSGTTCTIRLPKAIVLTNESE